MNKRTGRPKRVVPTTFKETAEPVVEPESVQPVAFSMPDEAEPVKMPEMVYLVKLERPKAFLRFEGNVYDFGTKQVRKVVAFEKRLATQIMNAYRGQFLQVNADVLGPFNPMPIEPPPTVAELSRQLASHFQAPGEFMTDLAQVLRETKGDVYPMVGAITLQELEDEVQTHHARMVRFDELNALNSELSSLRAEVAELRTRNLKV